MIHSMSIAFFQKDLLDFWSFSPCLPKALDRLWMASPGGRAPFPANLGLEDEIRQAEVGRGTGAGNRLNLGISQIFRPLVAAPLSLGVLHINPLF